MTNKIRVTILKAGFVCLILAACASSAAAQAPTSLYKRLGGYGAIAAVTDELNAGLPVTSNCMLAVVGASRWLFEEDEFW